MRSVLGLGLALLCNIGLTASVDIDYVQNPNFENCGAAQNPHFWTASFSERNEQYGCAVTTQLTGAAVSVYSVPTGFLTLQQAITLIPGLEYTVSFDYAYLATTCPNDRNANAALTLSLAGSTVTTYPEFPCTTSGPLATMSTTVTVPANSPAQVTLQIQAFAFVRGRLVLTNARVVGQAPPSVSTRSRARRKRIEAGKIAMPGWV